MFAKSRGSVSLAIELLDTEEENSDEPADAEVKLIQYSNTIKLRLQPDNCLQPCLCPEVKQLDIVWSKCYDKEQVEKCWVWSRTSPGKKGKLNL